MAHACQGPAKKPGQKGVVHLTRSCACEFVRLITNPDCQHVAGQSSSPSDHLSELLSNQKKLLLAEVAGYAERS